MTGRDPVGFPCSVDVAPILSNGSVSISLLFRDPRFSTIPVLFVGT
jgi:hypothetical protein